MRLSSVLSLRGPRLEGAGRVSVRRWSRDRLLRRGREELERARQTQCFSRIIHLALTKSQLSYELFDYFYRN